MNKEKFSQPFTFMHGKSFSNILIPIMFAIIYGSGFVGAKYELPYCPPLTFLAIRFTLAAGLIGLVAIALGSPWPKARDMFHISVAGILTVGVFSIGVFVSISLGIAPALSALIIALQPLLIGVLARRVVGEKVTSLQHLGLFLGFMGVAFVLGDRVELEGSSLFAVGMSAVGLLGVTAGNLYQKRFCAGMNLFAGGAIQSADSGVLAIFLASQLEDMKVQWTEPFIGALLYMTVGVSMGALSLLYIMIRRDNISKVASVFYLVPVSAATASFSFGESGYSGKLLLAFVLLHLV